MGVSMLIADVALRTLINFATFYLGGFVGAMGVVHAFRAMGRNASLDVTLED